MAKPLTFIIDNHQTFKAGDPEPTDYIDWHDWARVQYAAGLRQRRCPRCQLLQFPQSMGTHTCKPKAVTA